MSDVEKVMADVNIRQFKLMNGDEIICLVESINETNFMIDRPFKVIVNPIKTDAFNLVPWFDLSLTNTFTIDKSMVVAHAIVADSIKETYIKFSVTLDKASQYHLDNPYEDEDDTPNLIPDTTDTVH
jgi:hypothetical protein